MIPTLTLPLAESDFSFLPEYHHRPGSTLPRPNGGICWSLVLDGGNGALDKLQGEGNTNITRKSPVKNVHLPNRLRRLPSQLIPLLMDN